MINFILTLRYDQISHLRSALQTNFRFHTSSVTSVMSMINFISTHLRYDQISHLRSAWQNHDTDIKFRISAGRRRIMTHEHQISDLRRTSQDHDANTKFPHQSFRSPQCVAGSHSIVQSLTVNSTVQYREVQTHRESPQVVTVQYSIVQSQSQYSIVTVQFSQYSLTNTAYALTNSRMQFPISRLTKLLFQPSFSTKVAGHRLNCFCFPTQPSCHLWQRRFALKGCAWTIRERVEIKGTKISSKKGYQPVHISPIFTSSASYHPPPFILPNSISSNFIIFYYFILFYFYFLFFIFIFLFF